MASLSPPQGCSGPPTSLCPAVSSPSDLREPQTCVKVPSTAASAVQARGPLNPSAEPPIKLSGALLSLSVPSAISRLRGQPQPLCLHGATEWHSLQCPAVLGDRPGSKVPVVCGVGLSLSQTASPPADWLTTPADLCLTRVRRARWASPRVPSLCGVLLRTALEPSAGIQGPRIPPRLGPGSSQR